MAIRSGNGRFAKGSSGNPGGRPREVGDVRELARKRTAEAVAVLGDVMSDPNSPPAARLARKVQWLWPGKAAA